MERCRDRHTHRDILMQAERWRDTRTDIPTQKCMLVERWRDTETDMYIDIPEGMQGRWTDTQTDTHTSHFLNTHPICTLNIQWGPVYPLKHNELLVRYWTVKENVLNPKA